MQVAHGLGAEVAEAKDEASTPEPRRMHGVKLKETPRENGRTRTGRKFVGKFNSRWRSTRRRSARKKKSSEEKNNTRYEMGSL